jgi:hypothetical protein
MKERFVYPSCTWSPRSPRASWISRTDPPRTAGSRAYGMENEPAETAGSRRRFDLLFPVMPLEPAVPAGLLAHARRGRCPPGRRAPGREEKGK